MLRARTLPRLYAFLAGFVLTATALVACGSESLWSFDTRSPVVELAITPDGSRIAVGTWSRGEGNVYVLNASGDLLWSFHGDGPIRTLAITPDGSRVAAGTPDGEAYLLNEQGDLLWSFEDDTIGGGDHEAAINEVAMSADGSRVAVASQSGKVYLLDRWGELLRSLEAGPGARPDHTDDAFVAVAVTPDGSRTVAGSSNGKVYGLGSEGDLLWTVSRKWWVQTVAITPDGSRVAVGGNLDELYILDEAGDLLWSFHGDGPIRTLAITPDGSRVVAGTQGGKAYLLNGQGNLLWSFEDDTIGGGDYQVAITPDGSRVAVRDRKLVHMLDGGGNLLWSFERDDFVTRVKCLGILSGLFSLLKRPCADHVSAMAIPANGSLIAVSFDDGSGYMLDGERTTSSGGEIPRPVKLVVLLTGVFAAFGVGYWLRYRRGYRRVGISVLFLAALLYGAAIHLVAQAYDIPVDHLNLFLYWFLGVLPLAYVTRSQLILFLGIILFLAAVNVRIQSWGMDNVFNPFDIYTGYDTYYLAYPLYLVLGLMLYSLGQVQARFVQTRSYARAYDVLGVATVFWPLGLLGTYSFFDGPLVYSLDRHFDLGAIAVGFWVTLLGATALVAVAFAAAMYMETRHRRLFSGTLAYEGAAALLLLFAGYLVVFLPIKGETLYPFLFNFLLFLGIVGLILAGYFRGEQALINIALLSLGVAVIIRYLEFMFLVIINAQNPILAFTMGFILAVIILLMVGVPLYLGRRWVFRRMRDLVSQPGQ